MAEVSETSLSDTIQLSISANVAKTVSTIAETTYSTVASTNDDSEGPPLKKLKTITNDQLRPLEDRITSSLSCCICLDRSILPMYQCVNGHLMCSSCFYHLLTDYNLKDEQTVCPNCRCEISKTDYIRNLAVEKIILELPIACVYCSCTFLRREIKYHQSQTCQKRPTVCEYSLLGCDWTSSFHSLRSHVAVCEYPHKTGRQLLDTIRVQKQACDTEKKCFETALDLLSLNQISAHDLVLEPCRTDDFTAKLYFKTPVFTSLHYQWKVRACINDNTPHPHTAVTRSLSYQLVLKSNVSQAISLSFFIVKGPYSDWFTSQIQPIISHFEFNENDIETEYIKLPLSSQDCNRILSSSSISFRLWIVKDIRKSVIQNKL